ncbi:MAG: hypothetical protein KDA22_01115 [Phycisphaerales bacterium]|nr:hypothetical protein [Phycisphaerales bacterium]
MTSEKRESDETPTTRTTAGTIGTLLCRVVVPAWLFAGAAFKLWERNPKLLPKPILDTIVLIGKPLQLDDAGFAQLLSTSMRFLIGLEFVFVAVMLFVPLLARKAAIFVLALFNLILICLLTQEYQKAGWSGVFEGSCGCFGSSGPKPWVMLAIDLVLLLGVLAFRPNRSTGTAAGTTLGFVGAVAGISVALLVPDRAMTVPPTPPAPAGATTDGTTGADVATAWPDAGPAPSMYFPQFEKWMNQPLREQPMAQSINRPLPEGIDRGRWHVVFYRGDCDHCHDLIDAYIEGDLVPRTLLVRVPDTDPANDLPLPNRPFVMHHLPEGPDYVFTTPVLLTIADGVIVGIATDSENASEVRKALDAGAAAPAAAEPAAPAAAEEPTSPAPPSPAPATSPAAAPASAPTSAPASAAGKAWPKAPKVESMYFPQFEGWEGKRLDEQPLALQIQKPMPDLNTGRWHVLFYRADCDHCHDLIEMHIDGDVVEHTLLVRVPDTDPANEIPLPDRPFKIAVFPTGPDYVFTTPVLMTVVDGRIVCVAPDSDDFDQIAKCLDAE